MRLMHAFGSVGSNKVNQPRLLRIQNGTELLGGNHVVTAIFLVSRTECALAACPTGYEGNSLLFLSYSVSREACEHFGNAADVSVAHATLAFRPSVLGVALWCSSM